MMSGVDERDRDPEPESLPAPRPLLASQTLNIGRGTDPSDNGAEYIFVERAGRVLARFYGPEAEHLAELFVRELLFEGSM